MRVATRRKSLDRRLVSRPGPPRRGPRDRERTRWTMGVVARRPGRRDASCEGAKARRRDLKKCFMNHFISFIPIFARAPTRGTSIASVFWTRVRWNALDVARSSSLAMRRALATTRTTIEATKVFQSVAQSSDRARRTSTLCVRARRRKHRKERARSLDRARSRIRTRGRARIERF